MKQQLDDQTLVGHHKSLFFICQCIIYSMCTYICFLWQALEIQNLYKISVETHLQCLLCDSVQTQTSYLLSLPLHIKEDHNSLVLLPQNISNYCF